MGMRVLVTDGDNRAALAVTRSLGRAGHHVIVGERRAPSLAQLSRYCRLRLVYPDPARDEAGFFERIADCVRRERVDALIPISDIATAVVSCHRTELGSLCRVPIASADAIDRAANKADLLRTAMTLGLPVPKSQFIERPDQPFDRSEMSYPAVVKPYRSRVRTPGGWRSCSVGYARSEDELQSELRRRPQHEFPLILQERIVGPGVGMFVCYDRGEPIAVFSHRRLREKPPSGGVSVLSESVPVCPNARAYSDALLRELGWQGVAMVEFKRDERDGLPKLMEVNGRFWGSLQLAVDAGVDFPNILLGALEGRRPAPAQYRIGVKNRWFWGDVDALLLRLRAKSNRRALVDGHRGRAVLEFLSLWGPDLYYENPKLYDLRPWFYETARWFKGAA